jgi:DNA-binding transcriptional ArsR family regulator
VVTNAPARRARTASRPDPAEALTALADPTRRRIFERVAAGPAAVGELAAALPVSRPAVSQHLKVLREAQLVTVAAAGNRRIYEIDPQGIGALRDYLDGFWNRSLAAFKRVAESEQKEEQER